MSNPYTWRQRLLVAAEVQDIEFDAAALEAIDSAKDDGPLAQWVKQNIKSDQILTQDEVSIWRHIKKAPRRVVSGDETVDTSIPTDDAGFQEAIAALEDSTRSITSQIRTLEKQHAILASYQDRHVPDDKAGAFEAALGRKQQTEAQQLKFLSVDLLADLEVRLNLLQEKAEKSVKATPSIVNERLRADDRVIENLEQSIAEHETRSLAFDVPTQQKRVDDLLSALQQITITSVKDRLDRVYLETLQSGTDAQAQSDAQHLSRSTEDDQTQIGLLQDDLQSLYPEIDDVAAMLIQHEHGHPLQSILRTIENDQHESNLQHKRVVLSQLKSLTDDLDDLSTRYEHLYSHRAVLDQLQTNLNTIQERQRRHQQQRVQKTSSTTPHENNKSVHTPALDALLQHLNIDKNTINHSDQPSTRNTPIRSSFANNNAHTHRHTRTSSTSGVANFNQNPTTSSSTSTSTISDTLTQTRHLALHTAQEHSKQMADLHIDPSSFPSTFPPSFTHESARLKELDEAISRTKLEVESVFASSSNANINANANADTLRLNGKDERESKREGERENEEEKRKVDFIKERMGSENARGRFVEQWRMNAT